MTKQEFIDKHCIYISDRNRAELSSDLDAVIAVSGWISVEDRLPDALETVWLTNGVNWACLGCLVESDGGWHWAQSNGVIYVENGKIVSECESDDLDVTHWMPLPPIPNPAKR